MKILYTVLAVAAVVGIAAVALRSGPEPEPVDQEMLKAQFMSYVSAFGKNYGSVEEYEMRFAQFQKSDEEVRSHNAGAHTYEKGHNHMSDWTDEEFEKLLGYIPLKEEEKAKIPVYVPKPSNDIEWSWLDQGAVTPVKD